MSEQISDRTGLLNLVDRVKQLIPAKLRRGAAVVPVVRLSGVIGAVTPLRPGMSLAGVAKTLERAFATKNAKAVALVINSPGGSPVQSRQIYLRIRQLAAEKKLPVLVFVEDVAASGGYMIACAGDEIFCDPSSILGSIGVVGGSFGFQDLIKKMGVERRLYTAGAHKAMLDPFLPENPDDVSRVKALQREIHAIFIALVKGSRRRPGCARICLLGATDVNDKDRPMPPLIAFAGALGGLAVVRWAYKTAVRINKELEDARMARVAEAARSGDIPTLRRDPVTGAYRPG